MQPKSRPAGPQQGNTEASSWIQLSLFTLFLFLLVAIPYTIYLKASTPTKVVIANLPPVVKITPMPHITPPQASTTTVCITVPSSYQYIQATPAAYLFQDTTRQLCFPPTLPPFPFMWQAYTDYQNGYTVDTPSNWTDKSTAAGGIRQHIFTLEDSATPSATASLSFMWQPVDPYATQSSYLKQAVHVHGQSGTVYTKGVSFIAAIIPHGTGFLFLEASRVDTSFYAFEHMLESLQFN